MVGTHRSHVDDELPQRLVARASVQIPERVVDRTCSDVDHALFGADPAGMSAIYSENSDGERNVPTQLRIGDEVLPSLAHVGEERLDFLAHQAAGDLLDRGADDVIAAADGEGHAMADKFAGGEQ